MPVGLRTVAKELQNLVAGLGRRAERPSAEALTGRVAADVLGRDASLLSNQARSLAKLTVAPRGEGAAALRTAAADGFARNRRAGDQREAIVETLLSALFPEKGGYVVRGEQYLRDRHLKIALDEATGESRRIDFAVFKGEEVVRLLEVTSEKAAKGPQLAKEARMRRHGARYMLHPTTGERVRIAADVKTEVVRLP